MAVGNDAQGVSLGELWRNIIVDIGGASTVDITTMEAILTAFDSALFGYRPGGSDSSSVGPTGNLGATMSRADINNAALANTTGTLQLTAVYLPINTKISNFNFLAGATGDAGPTNQWMCLMNSSYVLAAISADATTRAITANTEVTYPVATIASGAATSYTTKINGLHYIGQLIATSNAPTFAGIAATNLTTAVTTLPPIMSGTSTGSLTTPSTFPTTYTAPTPTAGMRYQWLT